MKIKLYLTLLMLVVSFTSAAQIITLRGKVTDAKTGEAVPGASILSGSFGTSADANGNFVFYIQQSVVEESGITVSSIGFQTVHIVNITDNYTVPLTPAPHELGAINISAGADYIVQKAFRLISLNYLNKNFNITGFQRMIRSVRDTFGYQCYYQTKAKVKIYMSAYSDTPAVVQVGLMEKDEKFEKNPKSRRVLFRGGYGLTMTHDDVHLRSIVLWGNPDRFEYKLNRKELIDGRKTYVVNWYSKTKAGDAGILYIDSASFAFVKVLYTKYNNKIAGAINLDKISTFIRYRKYDDKWVLDAVKFNSITDVAGYDIEKTDEFQAGIIITDHPSQIPAVAVIGQHSVDIDIKPYEGFSAADKKLPLNIQKMMDNSFQNFKIPAIATEVHQ